MLYLKGKGVTNKWKESKKSKKKKIPIITKVNRCAKFKIEIYEKMSKIKKNIEKKSNKKDCKFLNEKKWKKRKNSR